MSTWYLNEMKSSSLMLFIKGAVVAEKEIPKLPYLIKRKFNERWGSFKLVFKNRFD